MKCSSRYRSCGFWEWVEEPISPLVRSVMEVKAKKATEKKVKCLAIVIFFCCVVILLLMWKGKVADCNCSCTCCRHEVVSAISM